MRKIVALVLAAAIAVSASAEPLSLPVNKATAITIVVPADAECHEFTAGPAPKFPYVEAKRLASKLTKLGYTNVSVTRGDADEGSYRVTSITGC